MPSTHMICRQIGKVEASTRVNGLCVNQCGWKDGDRGGPAQQQKLSEGGKRKTVLTHTGLLMEGLSPAPSSKELLGLRFPGPSVNVSCGKSVSGETGDMGKSS